MEQFETVKEVQEPLVDKATARRTIMMGSVIRAASLAAGVGVASIAMKVKPKLAVQAAVVPAVMELGFTYLQVRQCTDEQLEDGVLLRTSKNDLNDAAHNFLLGSIALVVGTVISRIIKPEETATE
jgi:hypothetical protein